MNAGRFRNSFSAILLLSALVHPARNTLAQLIEPPVVTILATDHHAAEAELDAGIFTVSRTGGTEAALLVFYHLSGTARNGVDYQELPRTVMIPVGAESAAITITPINDSLAEGTETVVATLAPSPTLSPIEPYRVGFPNSDVILLADNDRPATNRPPQVVIVTPVEGARFIAPTNILLGANAEDDSGVKSVEFFAGDRLIAQASGPLRTPFGTWLAHWTNPPPGHYTLSAKATDNLGAVGWSAPIHITVAPVEGSSIVLLAKGSAWKYLDNGSDQGTGWREPGFDDAAWKSGPAQLGFGDGDEATVLQAGTEDRRFVTYYFRRAFEVAKLDGISALNLRLLRDDGAVVYLNGTEVFRSNMPDGPITSETPALQAVGPDAERVFHSARLNPALLVAGRNLLAVEVHQVLPSSSDVSFDAELVAGSSVALPVVNIEAADAEGAEINPLLDIPSNPAVFKVTRTGETNKALRVFYRLSGTARNGVDYLELPGVVTIPEGAAAAEIVVQPIDDELVEGTESVVATLVPLFLTDPPAGADPYVVGHNARAEARIRDDDQPPPNALPSVRIVQPESGASFNAPASINIVAEVRDPDGWVGLVEFFAN
jgi:hypothetical protein